MLQKLYQGLYKTIKQQLFSCVMIKSLSTSQYIRIISEGSLLAILPPQE